METEVVYEEAGGTVRILRGSLVSVSAEFVQLKRRDGLYKIARKNVVLIHSPHANGGDYDGDEGT